MRRVLICGGRNYANSDQLHAVLTEKLQPGDIVIHGSARGADRLAHQWAVDHGHKVEEFPADWDAYGKSAGFKRNQQMIDSQPDLVIAFPGGRGTWDTIQRARTAGIPGIKIKGA